MKKSNLILYQNIFSIIFLTLLLGCQLQEKSKVDIKINAPFSEEIVTPDSCISWDLEERFFKIKLPENFKKLVPEPGNYFNLKSTSEFLNIGSAEIDLEIAMTLNSFNKKIDATEGFPLIFNHIRKYIDLFLIEEVMNNAILQFCNQPEAGLYSKVANKKIMINNLPANYSQIQIYGKLLPKKWRQLSLFLIPNPNDFSKSLMGWYMKDSDSLANLGKGQFLQSESFKIISNIEFLD